MNINVIILGFIIKIIDIYLLYIFFLFTDVGNPDFFNLICKKIILKNN